MGTVKIGDATFPVEKQGSSSVIKQLINIVNFAYVATPGAVTSISVAPVATIQLINSKGALNRLYAGFRTDVAGGGAALAPSYFALSISGGLEANNSVQSASFAGAGTLSRPLVFVSNQGFIDIDFERPLFITGASISILLFAAWTAALGITDTVTLNCFLDIRT